MRMTERLILQTETVALFIVSLCERSDTLSEFFSENLSFPCQYSINCLYPYFIYYQLRFIASETETIVK